MTSFGKGVGGFIAPVVELAEKKAVVQKICVTVESFV